MYHAIKGEVYKKCNGFIILDNNGIEYKIYCSEKSLDQIEGGFAYQKIFVILEHTEKAMILYGFISEAERTLFEALIKVDGIGSKVAMKVLSKLTVDDLNQAVINKDIKLLCSVPGIGSKSAAKLIQKIKI